MATSEEPLVTVYLTTRNRLDLLQRAIESVLEQTYRHIELIVVDDFSTDGVTPGYLTQMEAQGRLTAILMPSCGGACRARNAAIDRASGEFITGLDDDDYFAPDRVQDFVRLAMSCRARNLGYSMLYSDDIKLLKEGAVPTKKLDVVSLGDLLEGNQINNQVFTETSKLRAVRFDERLKMWQDWDVWIGLARHYGKAYKTDKPSYYFDCSHTYARITESKENFLFDVLAYFVKKHQMNRVQRVHVVSNLVRYYKPKNHWRFVWADDDVWVRCANVVNVVSWLFLNKLQRV